MFESVGDVQAYCRQAGIKMIDFKLTDLAGRWRHLTIPAERFDEAIMTAGVGFDASNYGYCAVEKSDMVFIPDLATGVVDSFASVPTLSMICDVQVIGQKENTPFDQYPRNVARRATQAMRDMRVADEMHVLPEFEFYVFDRMLAHTHSNRTGYRLYSDECGWPGGELTGNSYHTSFQGGYHIDMPTDRMYGLRSRMCMEMERWGIPVKYHHHEVGAAGQLEIETELGEMVRMADGVMSTKYIIRNMAAAEGMAATLMPKPVFAEAGSSMHLHMQLIKDGKPIFYDEQNYAKLSDTALYFIGGLLAHARSLCAFTNPSTNSYKRLVEGYEAPVLIGFGISNRSTMIRIPAYAKTPDVKRFELRTPDGTCNPYYAMAAVLMAGLDGIARKIDYREHNWGPFEKNLYHLPPEEKAKLGALPRSLEEALAALEQDCAYLLPAFPESLLTTWVAAKKKEAGMVNVIPHPKEFELYFDM